MTASSLLFISISLAAALSLHAGPAASADIKVLTAGAMKSVVLALQGGFEAASGHHLVVDNDTAGGLVRRIEAGEAFDMAIITPAAIDTLIGKGKMAGGSRVGIAKVGVGVAVKEGAPKPDLGSVDAFKRALIAASTIAYIDPASGGSSGIYVAGLLKKLGIADEIKPKERLQAGGYVAEKVAKGEAEIAIHQISEILPVKGVVLAGPLPEEIQNYTIYAAGLSATARDAKAAQAWIDYLKSPAASAAIEGRGMSRP
ncbi:MAG TPA: substrate-binding domain-containing protein [Bradyrhizobium sp.]|nr:substrate-binding domain-containing protein [Bradyrhizobium sp.]